MNDLYRQNKSVGEKMFPVWESFEDRLVETANYFDAREQIHQGYAPEIELAVEDRISEVIRHFVVGDAYRL